MHLISVPPAVAISDPPGSQAVASTGAPCSTVITHCKPSQTSHIASLVSGHEENAHLSSCRVQHCHAGLSILGRQVRVLHDLSELSYQGSLPGPHLLIPDIPHFACVVVRACKEHERSELPLLLTCRSVEAAKLQVHKEPLNTAHQTPNPGLL